MMAAKMEVVRLDIDWSRSLPRKKDGTLYGDERTVLAAIERAPDISGLVRYDEFRDVIEFDRAPPWAENILIGSPWSDAHRVELQVWLQTAGIQVNRASVVQDAVIAAARRKSYNPLKEYLKHLLWDQTPRLDTWLQAYLGADGDAKYLRAIGRAFLIGAAKRGYFPGTKMDNVLVLEAGQGRGKSTAVRILSKGWCTDYMPDLHSKDAAVQIQGTFVNEFSELAAIHRSDLESLKGFVTRSVDRYRPPYGRNAIERPRQCVFIGTTNLNEYLMDESGGRRFWPVRCRAIDTAALERDIDQLWAEAFWAGVVDDEEWHLPPDLEVLAQSEQEMRRLQSEHEVKLLEFLDAKRAPGAIVFMRQLLMEVAEFTDLAKQGREAGGIARQFSKILAVNGWEKCKPIGRGSGRRQPYQFVGECEETSKQLESAYENSDSIPF
jgi:putative DNA primase/helicase